MADNVATSIVQNREQSHNGQNDNNENDDLDKQQLLNLEEMMMSVSIQA